MVIVFSLGNPALADLMRKKKDEKKEAIIWRNRKGGGFSCTFLASPQKVPKNARQLPRG
jgi:hypothetical protein